MNWVRAATGQLPDEKPKPAAPSIKYRPPPMPGAPLASARAAYQAMVSSFGSPEHEAAREAFVQTIDRSYYRRAVWV